MFGAAGQGTGSASKPPGTPSYGSGSTAGDAGQAPNIASAFGNNRSSSIADMSQSVDMSGKFGQYFTAGKAGGLAGGPMQYGN